jgi:BASS family bile acid:Na+ symporter
VIRRPLAAAPRALTPLALAAAGLAIALPSASLARHSDLLLALLVLATALGISFADLARLRTQLADVALLSVVPLVVLAIVAWAIGRPFVAPIRDGLLAVGLSSSEVASVGLVALAGADATIALGAVTGSLILSALLGPLAIGLLAGGSGHGGGVHLLARFALVVILPLALGMALRSSARLTPRLQAADAERDGVAAVTVAVLVYAALSGTSGAHHLVSALVASVAFLAVSAGLAELWRRRTAPRPAAVPGAMAIAMRDFAVAAALATQAFGPAAGTVPGVYGVVMLLGGSAAAALIARGERVLPGGSRRRRSRR